MENINSTTYFKIIQFIPGIWLQHSIAVPSSSPLPLSKNSQPPQLIITDVPRETWIHAAELIKAFVPRNNMWVSFFFFFEDFIFKENFT